MPADTPSAWPRQSRTTLPTGNYGSCLNCHTPHGVSGTYDTGSAPATTNFIVSATAISALIPRQLIAREEALCLRCHDSTGPAATDIKSLVDSYLYITGDSATAGSGHPVRDKNRFGRHNLANESTTKTPPTATAGWFTSATMHAECTDCHNPHAARGRGTMTQDGLAAFNYGNVFQHSQDSTNTTGVFNTNRYAGGSTNSSTGPVLLGYPNIGVWGGNRQYRRWTHSFSGNSKSFANQLSYDLCFKCHSAWAWSATNTTGTDAPFNSPSTTKTWTGAAIPSNFVMTDIAWQLNTGNRAYHPVFAVGRNRPELTGVRNPNWCTGGISTYTPGNNCASAVGARADLATNVTEVVNGTTIYLNQTLSENFVPPWRHTSIITCVDCHEDEQQVDTTPRGAHGSARPFILRQLNTSISFNKCATAVAAAGGPCGSTAVVSYSGITDAPNFCVNCHRADVYGASGFAQVYPAFSRERHAMDSGGRSITAGNYVGGARSGIVCMGCHGGGGGNSTCTASPGSNCKLGNIHGNSYTDSTGNASRLIAPGGAWNGWTRGTTAAAGSCVKNGAANLNFNGCTNSSQGNFQGGVSTYNYNN